MPPLPQGVSCTYSAINHYSICINLNDAFDREPHPKYSLVLEKDMQSWWTMDPATTKQVQIYIQKLQQYAKDHCQ